MMSYDIIIILLYVYFAIYCAGSMAVLQLQHFALYLKVGSQNFGSYITANNRAAFLPSILPAIIVLILSVCLLFVNTSYVSMGVAVSAVALNVVNMVSSGALQARLHAELQSKGFDEIKIRKLAATNWIRTTVLFIQSVIASGIVYSALI